MYTPLSRVGIGMPRGFRPANRAPHRKAAIPGAESEGVRGRLEFRSAADPDGSLAVRGWDAPPGREFRAASAPCIPLAAAALRKPAYCGGKTRAAVAGTCDPPRPDTGARARTHSPCCLR